MFKLKNQSKVIYLFIILGLFLIINNSRYIIAMNNNQNTDTTSLSFLMSQGRQITEQIFNSQNNNLSERDIANLHIRNRQISEQIFALLNPPRNLRQRRTTNN